jgi:hypothetical protein
MGAAPEIRLPPSTIALPCSSTRLQKGNVSCRLLGSVNRYANYAFGFEGRLYQPGAHIPMAELPNPAVVLECAGPQGAYRRGKQRETLWILWRYDRGLSQWIELGRAPSLNWEWALTLREPAAKALETDGGFYDVIEKSSTLAAEIMAVIDAKLQPQREDLRVNVLASIYQTVACRMTD